MDPCLFAEFSFQSLSQYVLNGLLMGALFALIALGYTLVYGIIELVNFAHGDVFMLGCVLTYFLCMLAPEYPTSLIFIPLLLLIVPICCSLLNITINYLVYRPLRKAPRLVPLVSALGVSFVLINVGQMAIGTSPKSIQAQLLPSETSQSSANRETENATRSNEASEELTKPRRSWLTWADILLIGTVIPAMTGLALLVKFTKIGKAMRATAQNPIAARLMGINVEFVIALTFALGGIFAGLAAVVFTLKITTIDYLMGYKNGLYAFTAAVVGGVGSIPGAVLGGILIGLIYSLGAVYIGGAWVDACIFGTLIILLVFRPSGILGTRVREKV